MNRYLLQFAVFLMLSGCHTYPDEPSDQCKYAWSMRDQIKDIRPTTITEIQAKMRWMERAKDCDAHPKSVEL